MAVLLLSAVSAPAQSGEFNYDESKVPAYTLPDPLQMQDGRSVATAREWTDRRRPELKKLFENHVYGQVAPGPMSGMRFEVTSTDTHALAGLATRREVTVWLNGGTEGPRFHLLLYLPNAAPKPVPAFLALNFQGNHSIHPDPGITLSTSWVRETYDGVESNRATEAARGRAASRWPVELILERGYALATVY